MRPTGKRPDHRRKQAAHAPHAFLRRSCVIAFAIAVSSCGGTDNDDNSQSSVQAKRPPDPVDEAVFAIPPADRKTFRRALECEIARNKGPALDLNPEYLTELGQRLAEDPTLADC